MSDNVVSIAKATPTGSRIVVTDMPADSVAINVMGCWRGEWTKSAGLYLTEEAALVLLDALKEWKSTKEPGKELSAELIAKFAMQE